MDRWTPSGSGADFKLNKILEPLEKYKHLRDLVRESREQGQRELRAHDHPATWLSGVRPDSSSPGAQHGDDARPGDRREDRPGDGAALARSRLRDHGASRGLPVGRRLLLQHDAVVPQRHSPLPMEFNPRKVFLQLFGEGDTDAERAAIAAQTSSLLDLIADRTTALRSASSARSDRALLDST